MRRFWADSMEFWSELHLDVEEIRAQGDTVIGRVMWCGRGRASGVDVARELGVRFRLEAGRIASLRTFVNPEDAG